MFFINQVNKIEDNVYKVLMAERERYSVVYKTVEKYISEFLTGSDAIYLGGSQGVDLLFNRERSLDDYTYNLYSENAFIHANNLTNEIAKTQDFDNGGWVVVLLTKIPYQQYDIMVDNRSIITLYKLKTIGEGIHSLIMPINKLSYSKFTVAILSPEVYLISDYHTLCSPQLIGNWQQTLRNETKLFSLMSNRLNDLDSLINGGDEGGGDEGEGDKDTIDVEKEIMSVNYHEIEQTILRNIVDNNENLILIGEHAYRILKDRNMFHINVSLSTKVISVIGDINEIYESIKKMSVGSVTKYSKNVPVLEDFRLERGVIKINNKEVMYVYNSMFYDCVPYNEVCYKKSKIKVGTPFLIMRFLLVDLWMIRWIHKINMIDSKFAKMRIKNIISMIVAIRSKMQDPKIDVKTMSISDDELLGTKIITKLSTDIKDNLFGNNGELSVLGTNYLGQYVSDYLAIKLLIEKSNKKFPPYYPQKNYKRDKEYRTIKKDE